jgi:hypothetical protein
MRLLLLVPLIAACATPAVAVAGKSVSYEGLEVKQTLQTGTGKRVSTVYLRLSNPNPEAAEVRNIRCEFFDGGKFFKTISVPRLTVRPGMDKYELPERVEGPFDRPICKLGK